MAETQAVAEQALKKLEDQLTCAICLDAFKDPKLLQCFHVYCKDCLQRLVIRQDVDSQGQLSLTCPTCRQSTLLPATGVSGLQSAFHIHHLFEIQEALEKVKEPQNVQCEKCTKSIQTATKFCRDCGKFVCDKCTDVHSEWEDFSKHEVVSIDQVQSSVKQLIPPKKVVPLYCSQHHDQGKELDLYCETCGELICLHCTVKKHKDHQYDLVGDTFERHKAEITASLEPIENQFGVVNKAREQLDTRSLELDNLQATLEASVQTQIGRLQELLESRKAELIGQVKETIQMKKKNLAAQKDEVDTLHTQLEGCLSFVKESLRTGSQGEVMKMKKAVVKQMKEMTDNFKSDNLSPRESANVKFTASSELAASVCQQFGEVYLQASPEKSYATGKGLGVTRCNERATAIVHIVDDVGKACPTPAEALTSELITETHREKIDCIVKKTKANGQYEISYQATNRGRHQLHIKVEGEHIKGSPFPVTVKLPVEKLGSPIKIIGGLKKPYSVAINQKGNIIVSESGGHYVSIFSPAGKKIKSFGSRGSSLGQFNTPKGVALDFDDNILVADFHNDRILKFSPVGDIVSAVNSSKFKRPVGIAVHPHSRKVYVADSHNHCVQILNSDLTFSSSFGCRGNDRGQFQYPYDITFASSGNAYVIDGGNHCIQIFTADGQFLRKFGRKGKGSGELDWPNTISIDSEDVVYVIDQNNNRVSVFTCEGKFLTTFGTKGNGPGQFNYPYGVAVDKNGLVYVSDYANRLQVF